ncbi:hypothetical protein K466DRAFT_655953 [Polyporus arcularius HHB13444]|uniref:Protein kinase domain-containing protein n=1 Tax=Polyporus arcularius HHB13444 TaxID=1314778 RepID=A0A5C3NWR8_9APHY|nr:hypothetical protein K466DRAFT_655953 [Polyporus arcularius HHB13444]
MTSAQADACPPPLARNCVTVIRVDGLAVDHDGRTVALDLQRHSPGEVRQKHHGNVPAGYVGPYFVPEMPKVNLPIPPRPDQPRVKLHLHLGDMISFNERHAVYNVRVTRADPPAFYIPPLVIKVAQTDEAGRLLPKEAAMYEHIRKLQGVVAPRFYGYFHAKNRSSEWTRISPRGSTSDTDELDADEGSPFLDDEEEPEPAPEGPPACTRMDILLLEKVGEHLPHGEQMSTQDIFDLRDMYHDLSRMHVDHFDYHAANVTYAPLSPPGLPGKRSPYHKRVYGLRLIDFEGAQLTTRTPMHQRKLVQEHLPGLLSDIMAL